MLRADGAHLSGSRRPRTRGGWSVLEVIDLRSLSPLDLGPVFDSVARTGRAIVVHEAPVFGGLGAEIASRISEKCFFSPKRRCCGSVRHTLPTRRPNSNTTTCLTSIASWMPWTPLGDVMQTFRMPGRW